MRRWASRSRRVAGDWDSVRILRTDLSTRRRPAGAPGLRRRAGPAGGAAKAPWSAGLPADLASRLAPLDDVLDTYADLLVADGVHALVTGHADLANAAMEAAAGLGAPPDLRAIRTPRAATTVRVGAWALLPPGAAPAEPPDQMRIPRPSADPAYAALLSAEIGPDALHASDPAGRDARNRMASLLGGGDDPLVPSLTGGTTPGCRPAPMPTCGPRSRPTSAPDSTGCASSPRTRMTRWSGSTPTPRRRVPRSRPRQRAGRST